MILFQVQTESPLGLNGWVTDSIHQSQNLAQEKLRELKTLYPEFKHRVTEYS